MDRDISLRCLSYLRSIVDTSVSTVRALHVPTLCIVGSSISVVCAKATVMFRLLFFFGLFFGVVRNRNLNRFVRFNAMQALLIDILLM